MRRRHRLTPLAAAVALALTATACGDDGSETPTSNAPQPGQTGQTTQPAPTATNPIATAPEATTPPPDATEPDARTIAPPPPEQTEPEADQPPPNTEPPSSEAEPVQVRADFTLANGRLEPPAITVPPFLAIALSIAAPEGGDHQVVIRTPDPIELDVSGGSGATARVPGLRAGRYAIEVDGRAAGALDVGGEVGP